MLHMLFSDISGGFYLAPMLNNFATGLLVFDYRKIWTSSCHCNHSISRGAFL